MKKLIEEGPPHPLAANSPSTKSGSRSAFRMGEFILLASTFAAAWLALGTELLSALHALTPTGVTWFWAISLLIWLSAVLLFIRPRRIFLKQVTDRTILKGKLDILSLVWVVLVILIVAVLLVVTLIAPPNTNDSLAYHMARVAAWAQQGSLDFYTTPISRQLWMPPWAEWAVLHLYLLAGNDQLANLVQWLAMVGSLLASALLALRMSGGFHARAAILTALFCATLPMGALQATSTQTDYVTAFWLVCLAYWTVLAHQRYPRGERLTAVQWAGLACAVGLGILTKGTYYVFAAPFLAWLLVSMLRAQPSSDRQSATGNAWIGKSALIALALVVSIVIIVSLNAGTWLRNQSAYGFPLGPPTTVSDLSNEIFSSSVLISNLLRNSTLHMASYGVVNGLLSQVVERIHDWIGLDASDPRTSLSDYDIRRSRHEDYAGNFWHFFLIGLSMLIIAYYSLRALRRPLKGDDKLTTRDRSLLAVYALALIAGFVIFSALYKWQPTGSRLQLPLFVAAAPLVGCIFSYPLDIIGSSLSSLKHIPIIIVSIILILAGYPSIVSNPSRPLIVDSASAVENNILATSRRDLLFINSPEWAPGYLSLAEAVSSLGVCNYFGLILDSHDPAYPFWALQQPAYEPTNSRPITWVYLDNSLGEIVPPPASDRTGGSAQICAVICTMCSDQILDIPSVGRFVLESNHYGGFTFYRPQISDQ